MLGLFTNIAAVWREAKLLGLLALLLGALGLQQSCERPHARPGFNSVFPAAQAGALLPAQVLASVPGSRPWVPGDTSREARPNLQLKMLPRARWGSAGAYLIFPRPRRPRQGALDSAAAAARPHGHE